jgi:hypothetical protein
MDVDYINFGAEAEVEDVDDDEAISLGRNRDLEVWEEFVMVAYVMVIVEEECS